MICLTALSFNDLYFEICDYSEDEQFNPYLYTNGWYLKNNDSMEIVIAKYKKSFLKRVFKKHHLKVDLTQEIIKIYIKDITL